MSLWFLDSTAKLNLGKKPLQATKLIQLSGGKIAALVLGVQSILSSL
tara:strand:+ start:5157 stop:5297 length:141 start_codon:yes stop_codon:yes gene_type:complete